LKKNKDFNPNKDFYVLSVLSLVLFILVIVAFRREANPEWKKYQIEFQSYLETNVDSKLAAALEISVKQIWLPELNRVDRCISCHVGYDNPDLKDAPEPFKAHPNIDPHSMARLGCTICHGGQGFSLKKKDAHGETENWEEPLLGKNLAKRYGLEDPSALIQINCNICHRREAETPGLDMINLAKSLLTQNKKCRTCHTIDGTGGTVSSELTDIGDKPPERFDFSQIEEKLLSSERPLSMLSWHFEHFMNPKTVVPNSKMPYVEYSQREAMSLAMLMMSWKKFSLPVILIPKAQPEKLPEEEKIDQRQLTQVEWGKELFENKGCVECHTIGKGVEVGPDLHGIVGKRDPDWLRKMISNPEEMEKTDPIAQKLFLEYEEFGMPTEPLTQEEIDAILEYIKSVSRNMIP
jgi:cytochrome c2